MSFFNTWTDKQNLCNSKYLHEPVFQTKIKSHSIGKSQWFLHWTKCEHSLDCSSESWFEMLLYLWSNHLFDCYPTTRWLISVDNKGKSSPRPAILLKFAKYLRTPFLQITSERLLLWEDWKIACICSSEE